mgnify:CR=1 FL=1
MRISKQKQDKIIEQILAYLYHTNPKSQFTAHIARELARDEEFIKKILQDMKSKGFISEVKKNPKGIDYKRRSRWKLSGSTYEVYTKHQG